MSGRAVREVAGSIAAAMLSIAVLSIATVACGADGPTKPSGPANGAAAAGEAVGVPFDDARCAANRKAGKLTFLTSFDYAAAASIIDVVAAKERGLYTDVCLDVELQPGFSTANVAAVAAGKAQMTSMGSFSEVVTANAQDAGLVAVAVEGKTSIEELLVENGKGIAKLSDLSGKSMGIKGAIPFSIRAMLAGAKVSESSIKQVEVGFNPVTLFETEIDALPVYKSNEPGQLDAAGYKGKYTVFDPREAKIPSSFAVFTTSRSFATANPTAVADFLRATLKGFEWADANPDAAVKLTLAKSDPNLFFSPDGEKFRWTTEARLVKETTPAGQPIGSIDPKGLEGEVQALIDLGVIPKGKVDVAKAYDTKFLAEVTKDGKVVWTDK